VARTRVRRGALLEVLCDRVLVFYRGRVCAELAGTRLRVHTVLEAMNTGRLAA
jgi:ABC-type sugar transport system ATPase subunit